jgi:SAM-dependent methyltransferase
MLIDILLLRTWHVHRAIRQTGKDLPKEAAVLDAGSGMGQYSWKMSRMFRQWRIRGIDIIASQVEGCNRFVKNAGASGRVEFAVADLTKLTDTEKYDLILTVDVMEHIEEDELVFSNFFRSLRKNGKVIISTPSDLGGSDAHSHSDGSFIDEHVRNGYGADEITLKLGRAGFSDIVVRYTYGWQGSLSWKLSMKYPVKMLNRSYFFFLLLPFWYIIAMPFSLILNFLDLNCRHKSGTGLLVTATRK